MQDMFDKGEPYEYPEEITDKFGNKVRTGKMLKADPVKIFIEESVLKRHRAAWKAMGVTCFAHFVKIAEIEAHFGRDLHLNTGGHGSSVGK